MKEAPHPQEEEALLLSEVVVTEVAVDLLEQVPLASYHEAVGVIEVAVASFHEEDLQEVEVDHLEVVTEVVEAFLGADHLEAVVIEVEAALEAEVEAHAEEEAAVAADERPNNSEFCF